MDDKSQADRLESWKAIARYLGRSVRTARRWEVEEDMPVHRQMHKSQGSVYAYRSELDAWRRRMEQTEAQDDGEAAADAPLTDARRKPEQSVAVLPFKYLGRDSESAYIADGFTEEIIIGLSRIPHLRVISWTSSMTFRDSNKSAPAIGRELGVEQLVEGTVRQEGARIRVAARLVHAGKDDRVWSHTYEGSLDDVFAIQDSIAAKVVDCLDLGQQSEATGFGAGHPSDVVAWQFLVQARQASLRWRKDSIDTAVRLLRDGLSLTGDDPRLHAALGRAYLHYREAGFNLGDTPLEQAEASATRALELEPGLAAGQQLKGWIQYSRGDVQAAVDMLKRAHESEPGDPDTLALLANCYLISGRVAEAEPLIERLCAIDPLTPLTRCLPGWASALRGDFESAVGPYRDMFTMDPDNPVGRLFYVFILAGAGRDAEARRVADGVPPPILGTLTGKIIGLFGSALRGHGEISLAEEDEAALALGTEVLPRFVAQGYALAGDSDSAVKWMSVAVDKGFVNYPFMAQHDPFLAPLAGNAGYDALLEDVRERWTSFRP